MREDEIDVHILAILNAMSTELSLGVITIPHNTEGLSKQLPIMHENIRPSNVSKVHYDVNDCVNPSYRKPFPSPPHWVKRGLFDRSKKNRIFGWQYASFSIKLGSIGLSCRTTT